MTDHDPLDDLLAGLRTDVPEMSDEAFEAGRSRLRATVAPEPVVIALAPDTAVAAPPKGRLLRSPPRRLATVAAAAAAAVALAAGAVFVQATRHDVTPATPAAALLNTAADNVALVDEPIRPDQYRYSVSHTWNTVTDKTGNVYAAMPIMVMVETVHEQWIPADPARQCVYRTSSTGEHQYLAGDAAMAEREGLAYMLPTRRSDEPRTEACDEGGDRFWAPDDAELLASLPRDPAQLNDRLRNDNKRLMHSNDDADVKLVAAVKLLLTSGIMPADLRAALYRTLAMTPGIKITEQVVDLDGRKGTAFGLSGHGYRDEVVIDTATGEYIGGRWFIEEKQPPTGAPASSASTPTKDVILSYTTMTEPVVVDRVGDTR